MAISGHTIWLASSMGLLTLTWAMTFVIALNQRECLFSLVAEGRLPAAAPLSTNQAVRPARCALSCVTSHRPICHGLGYSQEKRECRLYSVFNTSDVTEASPGYKYYSACPVRIGEPCGDPKDCSATPNAECRDEACQCVAGFHFYPRHEQCIRACPDGYGDGYYTVRNHGMHKSNLAGPWFYLTEAECWGKCKVYPSCSSFERSNDTCYIQNMTALEAPDKYGFFDGWNYSQRHCA